LSLPLPLLLLRGARGFLWRSSERILLQARIQCSLTRLLQILFYFIVFLATQFSKKEKILSPISPFSIKNLAKLQQKMVSFFFVLEGAGESVATFISTG
jgi:hypothetical protein